MHFSLLIAFHNVLKKHETLYTYFSLDFLQKIKFLRFLQFCFFSLRLGYKKSFAPSPLSLSKLINNLKKGRTEKYFSCLKTYVL